MPYLDTGRASVFFEDAGRGGIPVLLLHELGGSRESWREVIPLLATDRRVIAVDLRCAGRSEKPLDGFSLADVADDLDALLAAALKQIGSKKSRVGRIHPISVGFD